MLAVTVYLLPPGAGGLLATSIRAVQSELLQPIRSDFFLEPVKVKD